MKLGNDGSKRKRTEKREDADLKFASPCIIIQLK
jgi:hypothetical protein